ncbi:MAG: hypothetical protein K5924_09350 [Chloroflexi bacterium]|nr:hypothetical protein [Chloroflexota bacterium]
MRRFVTLSAAALLAVAFTGFAPIGAAAVGTAGCNLVAALGNQPTESGSDEITVKLDQEMIFWGTYPPDTWMEVEWTNGDESSAWHSPILSEADGLVRWLWYPGEVGRWSAIVDQPGTDCSGTVIVTVVADDTPPTVPDTAVAAMTQPSETGSLGSLVAGALLISGGLMLVSRRIPRPSGHR